MFSFLKALDVLSLGMFSRLRLSAMPPDDGSDVVVDQLSVPGPIRVDGVDYLLVWSARPTPTYYKQEYVAATETAERYQRMVLVELVVGDDDMDSIVAAQVKMIEARKASDPVANIAVMKSAATGETIADFLLSARLPSGEDVVEWNAYRYLPHAEGVMLFGLSRRAYGEEAMAFLKGLGAERIRVIQSLAAMEMPTVDAH
ncbi:hypothetical protein FXN63_14575 [Pigmentiphaga aceris]|uniref:Uncharacterized protein n=1 Tax=Pigmentiphaga aceris TaxID=1940612 RepID=A0A5C0AZ98_9BURK|nr:hypothetical protein [Pigmentiphaga aceris]QEI06924.1 hypothetical protein FXN63_14575 [Pigmentiphaga aceris]